MLKANSGQAGWRGLLLVGMGAVFGVLSTLAIAVLADGDPATDSVPRMFPYQGILESDGQPITATGDDAIAMQLALYYGEGAQEQPVYTQDVEVEVYAGRFTTTIGPTGHDAQGASVEIAEIIRGADTLYLGIVLLGDESEDDVPLSNRQRIHATPYAMWSTTATDLTVANTLRVASNAVVGGDLAVGSDLTVDDDLTVEGELTATRAVADTATLDLLDVTGSATIDQLEVTEGLSGQSGSVRLFGAWQSGFEFDTTYTAPADGFVVAYAYRAPPGSHVRLNGFTPSDVLRVRDYNRVEEGDVSPSIFMPVRQGDTWRVTRGGGGITSFGLSYLRLGQ